MDRSRPVGRFKEKNWPVVVGRCPARPHGATESHQNMIKLVYCITKKPGMTDEVFFHYWEHVHGPIGARIPGVRRLVQVIAFLCPATPEARTTTAWLSCGLIPWRRYCKRAEAPSGGQRARMRKTSLIILKSLILSQRSIPSFSHIRKRSIMRSRIKHARWNLPPSTGAVPNPT